MAKARQQYLSDEVAIKKEALTFNFDRELLDKIIHNPGEENVIEIVKVNGTALIPDAQKAVDVPVPLVVDSLDSVDPNASLSAYQGKILYDYILQLQSRGRFLSNWDAVNGIPVTTPFGSSYTYNPGDYYVVGVIAGSGGTNLRPDASTYSTGYHSTTPETDTIDIGDMYVWDGAQWILTKSSARQITIDQALSTTSTNPVENRVITNALNTKQPLLTEGTNIHIDQNTWTISADDTTYPNLPAAEGGTDDSLVTTGEKYIWNNKQDGLQAGANIQIVGNVISATDTRYLNLPAAEGGTDNSLVTTGDKYNWDNKQDRLTAGANIQIVGDVISATDTIYTGGTGINISNNNIISVTNDVGVWGHITGTLSDQLDLQAALDAKQDKLIEGANIHIDPNTNVISADNTTYTASDFDIKDLSDSLDLRNTWSNKQDRLIPGTRISIQNNVISADVSGVLIYRGNVNSISDLPSSGQSVGDVYFVEGANSMYAWDGNKWNNVGGIGINLSNYFNKITDTSDSIIQGNNNLFVSQTEKNIWNSKQDRLTAGTNITIANNVISAKEYTAGSNISVSANGRIDNTAPFTPEPGGSVGQVLKKTSTGYSWQNESGGGGGGGNFDPGNTGSPGQVLTKYLGNTYKWMDIELPSGENNVKFWTINSHTVGVAPLQEIYEWVNADDNNGAIINDTYTNDVYVYNKIDNSGLTPKAVFFGVKRNSAIKEWISGNTSHGYYTVQWQTELDIIVSGQQYGIMVRENPDDDTHTNYVSALGANYPSPFMPTEGTQPATKAYVDAVAAGSVSVSAITNNTTGTTYTVNQEWVGTQAQYNAITPVNGVIYNIIPSS